MSLRRKDICIHGLVKILTSRSNALRTYSFERHPPTNQNPRPMNADVFNVHSTEHLGTADIEIRLGPTTPLRLGYGPVGLWPIKRRPSTLKVRRCPRRFRCAQSSKSRTNSPAHAGRDSHSTTATLSILPILIGTPRVYPGPSLLD
jgi:hypothetical protein